MRDDSADEFELRIAFGIGIPTAAVGVVGDIDLLTAPSLAGVLDALIDGGRQRIDLNLAESAFVDARGAAVFDAAARRLAPAGGTLTIRSPSASTRLMLTVAAVNDLVVVLEAAQLAPSSSATVDSDSSRSSIVTSEDLAPLLAPIRFTTSSTEVTDAALRLVTALADATVANADGVSVTLERHGRLMTVAASNDAVLTMDRHQYETGEGPCLDAKAQNRGFYIESLEDETRWPTFVPLALGQGIHSILSSPLKTHDQAQGALNMYSATKQAFGEREQHLAALFAGQASQVLTAAGQHASDELAHQRFAKGLAARQVIHQAQGMIMARDGLSADDAIGVLFRAAREANVTVLAHATDLVASLHPESGK